MPRSWRQSLLPSEGFPMPTATPGTPATITFPVPPAAPAGQRQPNLLNRLARRLAVPALRPANRTDVPAGGRVRHPDHSETPGAHGCQHNHDRHPRSQQEMPRGSESGGCPRSRLRQSAFPGPKMSARNRQRLAGREVTGFSPNAQRGFMQTV